MKVMKVVDRANYVRGGSAYGDHPEPIGDGQTISAPHMHGFALEYLEPLLRPGSRVLDIGCGSGYLTSCFGYMVRPGGEVIGVENRESLVELARSNIARADSQLLDSHVVDIRLGNGWTGEGFWKEGDDLFDVIHIGAAAASIPDVILRCLKAPGRMVVPVGAEGESQSFVVVRKFEDGSITQNELMSVMYVPLENQVHVRGA
jgi:protein-L-isoaspartate(D-aspartate) O-methyltransferase